MKVERVEIKQLTADPANVRKHNAKNLKAIEASLRRFGQQKPIVVDGDGIVRAGNGTLAAAQQLGWTHIDIVRTNLKGTDATAYSIADNRTAELAEWDEEALAQQLAAIQIEDEELVESCGFDADSMKSLGIAEPDSDDQPSWRNYTAKIHTPIYEPSGDCPTMSEMLDRTKVVELINEIDKAHIPSDVAAFLKYAAERHAVFTYSKVANFYAHQSKEVQLLMERSALVIIDFDAAIENGFVKMTDTLANLVGTGAEDE
jgi:hypothetical protein